MLIRRDTRVIVQGITGKAGSFQTGQMLDFGTNIVAGVTPGRGGEEVHGVPVFDSVEEGVAETGADASVIFVPARSAADAMFEASDAGIGLMVCITEGVPVKDTMRVCRYIEGRARLIGPNCPGITVPGDCKIGIMPNGIHLPGRVGVVSRSGTLTYELVELLTRNGIGQSASIGIGGDPVPGMSFLDALSLFEKDEKTYAVLLVGEIGGTSEEDAAGFIRTMGKPVVAYVVGITAPPEKTMGHAGAIITDRSGTAQDKIYALEKGGALIATGPGDVVAKVKLALENRDAVS